MCGGASDRGGLCILRASNARCREAHALAGCCHGAIDRLAGAGVTGYMNATENRFVEDYRFAASVGACRVYLANDIQTHAERASALTYVEQFKAECAQYPWVYISWYALLPRASVIRCDRPMKEPNRCISDYFLKDS